ncbi:MAG: hypothetical protein COA73_17925 [Candidatus Hydrogenedentota bacterium]|nr:MAG: hypothetical protein COA73_17925 [Candidatus Hydrogenedentota bacterium]
MVEESFQRIGKLDVDVGWADDADFRLGYRTRATFQHRDGAWGFFESGSHTVVDIPACPLLHPKLNAAFELLRGSRANQSVEITVNPEGDEVLVWTSKADAKLETLFPMYNAAGSGTKRHRFMFDGIPVVNGLFSQSSLVLNRVLRREVERQIGEPASLLDLYSGTGNLSLKYAESCRVVGIDHSGPAIMAAHALERGEYQVGDETRFSELILQEPWDVIVLDPPRTGAKRLLKALGKAKANRIVYVSCDPATLARDAGQLAKTGWKLREAVAVDLFPHTVHIETVCRFER